ncbi:hypothetical protein E2C01_092601 [Portunus trituberculatus]|uniref:Uncharacterized protein n=1 Tax=Portunus trituberculatus TaxID=210409 RepID=A0A5B7JSH1_PORTR|nr:hypothetical protein [Portunus trituberculatus]
MTMLAAGTGQQCSSSHLLHNGERGESNCVLALESCAGCNGYGEGKGRI